jgi:hypothetical protein
VALLSPGHLYFFFDALGSLCISVTRYVVVKVFVVIGTRRYVFLSRFSDGGRFGIFRRGTVCTFGPGQSWTGTVLLTTLCCLGSTERFFSLFNECHWNFDGYCIKPVDYFWELSAFSLC